MQSDPLKILYLGPLVHHSGGLANAIRRLGHEVEAYDTYSELPGRYAGAWAFKTGGLGLCGMVRRNILRWVSGRTFDVCVVNTGELLDRETVRCLRSICRRVVNYNQDNPFSGRDGWRWRAFLRAAQEYDLLVTLRDSNVEPMRRIGARRVIRSWFSADEAAHAPVEMMPEERARFASEVAFIGTWMPERGPFMVKLLEAGVPLRIYGPRWHKSPEQEALKGALSSQDANGRNYACAITGARISLALLSKGNEDLHTTRSMEIPSIGGLLCGERTREHLALYEEGREALFWADAAECARVCRYYLDHPEEAERLRKNGHARALRNGHFNENAMRNLLNEALATPRRADL